MEDKIECSIFNIDEMIYIIPNDLLEEFESTPEYEREHKFNRYILPEDAVINEVLINKSDIDNMLDGWF